ncbi:MAG: TlpA disulfide reductase family protein [Roseovarius sp.]|nr:TlpA disulfide reductase family protein [Roseovarius sp.]
MKRVLGIVLYMALALGANPALADSARAEALREGDMKKLMFHSAPQPAPQVEFERGEGGAGTLGDYRGRVALVNFWATWCAPCRAEMPTLSALEREMGGEDFAVVTIATGRNPLPAMKKFMDEIGADNLPLHRDPKSALARQMGVFGLPMTMILDAEGREIGRLTGDADWNSDSARAIIAALTGESDG